MTLRGGRFERWIVAIAAISLVGKLLYLFTEKYGDNDLTDEGDALYYGTQAKLNASGHWFVQPELGGPGADHPPLTSLVLTPAAWITDGSFLAMRLTMTMIGVAVVVGLGLLGRRVGGDRVGLIAAALGGAYAALWVNDALLMSDTLAALGTVATLLAGYRLHDCRDLPAAALFGVAGGFAALARAELALLLPLVGLIVLLARRRRTPGDDRTEVFRVLAVGAVAAVAVVAPWIGWNLSRFEDPVLLSSNDGLTLIGANCEEIYDTPAIGFWQLQCALDRPVEGDPSEVSTAWRSEAFEYIGDNLDRLPAVTAARLGRTFGVFEPRQMVYFNGNEGREAWVSWLALYQYWAIALLAIVGAVIGVRRGLFVAPLLPPVVVVVLITVAFYGLFRFRIPADVVGVVLAAVAVDAGVDRLARAWGHRLGHDA